MPGLTSHARSADPSKPRLSGLAVFGLALLSTGAGAQDLEPRAYANTPVGMNFLIAGYGHMEGGVGTDPALPIENMKVEVHSALVAYARSLDVLGRSAKFDVVLPYAWTEANATVFGRFRERRIDGLADPRFRFSVNLLGAPALSMKEFAAYQQDTIVGVSLDVTAPGGQYDADKLINNGTNRWSVKPEIGVSQRIGPVTLELAGGVRFYTDNDDFLNGHVRSQDPMYLLQGHLIYSFPYGIWAALNGTFYTGGTSAVDGRKNDDRQENSRVGLTVALPVNPNHSVKLYASTGVTTRTGSDFDAAGIAWQYRFGGGI